MPIYLITTPILTAPEAATGDISANIVLNNYSAFLNPPTSPALSAIDIGIAIVKNGSTILQEKAVGGVSADFGDPTDTDSFTSESFSFLIPGQSLSPGDTLQFAVNVIDGVQGDAQGGFDLETGERTLTFTPDVENSTYVPCKDEAFDSVQNLLSPETSYNLRLSPARNFKRHLYWLNPSLLKYASEIYRFQEGKDNYEMITKMISGFDNDFLGQDLREGQDIDQSFYPSLFDPIYITFTAPFRLDTWLSLRDNPLNRYKLIKVSDTDNGHFEGWIWSVKVNIDSWTIEYKLLKKA